MPQIKEEDLIKLYSDLDKLEEEKTALEKGFVDIKLKLNSITKKYKKSKWIVLFLVIIFVASTAYFYTNHIKTKATIEKTKDEKTALLDSIHKITIPIVDKKTPEVIYSIQLGIYKGLDIKFNSEEATNFAKVETDNGTAYQIGSFLTYKRATEFKNELNKIGLNHVFIIVYDKNKQRIPISKALVLSDEEALLKD